MGDGHHGWAAAEVALFLRNALIREEGRHLALLRGYGEILPAQARGLSVHNAPTAFGSISFSFRREEDQRWLFEMPTRFNQEYGPETITAHIPFPAREATDTSGHPAVQVQHDREGTLLAVHPGAGNIKVRLSPTD
jgi:hypothetical protein